MATNNKIIWFIFNTSWCSFPNGCVWSGVAKCAAGRVVLLQQSSIQGGAVGMRDLDIILLWPYQKRHWTHVHERGMKTDTVRWGPFHWHGLNFNLSMEIRNHMPCKVSYLITYLFPNFNGFPVTFRNGKVTAFHTFIESKYSLESKLIQVSKRGPWFIQTPDTTITV